MPEQLAAGKKRSKSHESPTLQKLKDDVPCSAQALVPTNPPELDAAEANPTSASALLGRNPTLHKSISPKYRCLCLLKFLHKSTQDPR